jgi:hypothetical protein
MKYSITKLSPNSNKNINYILHHYSNLIKPNIKNNYFIKLLYTLIERSSNKNTQHSVIKKLNEFINIPHTHFISQEIVSYIKSNTFIYYNVFIKIKEINFNINIYSKKEININKYIYFIKLILNLCALESETLNNNKNYTFKIILTDFKKSQPSIPVNPSNINSGLTDPNNNEIIIFRKEEWFKVFIHECFHLFCLDFSDFNDTSYKKMFQPLFNINSDFLFFESLCEFWSRTLNLSIISYSTKKNISFEDFENLIKINIKLEIIYSLVQMKHILGNMGFTYESLLDKNREKEFTENTNMFCYYVLTPILLFHYEQTITWFINNNETLLQFKKNKQNILLFFYYIKTIYKNDIFIQFLHKLKDYKLSNNYMDLFEITF